MAKTIGFFKIEAKDDKRTTADLLAEAKREPVDDPHTRQAVSNYVYLSTAKERAQKPTTSDDGDQEPTFADLLEKAPQIPANSRVESLSKAVDDLQRELDAQKEEKRRQLEAETDLLLADIAAKQYRNATK